MQIFFAEVAKRNPRVLEKKTPFSWPLYPMIPADGIALTLSEFQTAFMPLVGGVIVLSFFLPETGASGIKTSTRKQSLAVD
ncbi:hypothetical protein [Paraglaciecola sp. 25GB23A]|uniref:hypothetical protein n=1 Tax=Paraglaciecola sp. 25GB23A TaxID=3156068 RepID=UPI0032B022AF